MKNCKFLRAGIVLLCLLLGLPYTTALANPNLDDSPGLQNISLTDDCAGTVEMTFIYSVDAWAGVYCASCCTINSTKDLDDAYIYATVGGSSVDILRIDKGGSGGGHQWYDDAGCRGNGARLYAQNGHKFSWGSRTVNGGGCWGAYSNCKKFYATVTFQIPQEWFGRTINFGMRGRWDGGNFNENNFIISQPGIPTPMGLQAASQCSQVELTWSLPTKNCGDNTKYQIRRDGTTIIASNLSRTTTSYVDSRPVYDEYEYEIRAKHSAAAGTFYTPWQTIVRGSPRKPVDTPVNLRVDQDNCEDDASNLALQLEWTNDATNLPSEFRVYRSTNNSFNTSLPNTVVGRDRSWFVDDGSQLGALAFDQTYYYWVRAIDHTCGTSATSVSDSYSTRSAPSKPTGVTAAMQADNTIRVNWSHNGLRTSFYTIERTPIGSGSTYSEVISELSQRSWVDTRVENCSEYEYRVIAHSYKISSTECFSPIRSEPSGTVQVQINDILNTFAPNFLTVSKGYYPDRVRLDWVYSGNRIIDNFLIYRRPLGAAAAWSEIEVVDAPRSYYEDLMAVAGRLYEYGVVAQINNCGGAALESDSHPSKGARYRAVGFRTPTGIVNGKITFNGGIALEGAKVYATRAEAAVGGVSLELDGDDYLSIADGGWFPQTEFTVSAWLHPTAPANGQGILNKGADFDLRMTNVGPVTLPVYRTNYDTVRSIYQTNVFGDVVNDSVYSLDGSTLLGWFRHDSLYTLQRYSMWGVAQGDSIRQPRSPYNLMYIRTRDIMQGYDTLHQPQFSTYTYEVPGSVWGAISGDTVRHPGVDSVRAFFRRDTLYKAVYVPQYSEKGDAFAHLQGDTLWQMGGGGFSVLQDDAFVNGSGTTVAFMDGEYLRTALHGQNGNVTEGAVYGLIANDTAWTYDPQTFYQIQQTDTLAVRLLDTLYGYPNLSAIRYFKAGDTLRVADYATASGYLPGAPQYMLWKNVALNLAMDSIAGIYRGDSLYTHTLEFAGLRGADDTVRMAGNPLAYVNGASRAFYLGYDDVVNEVREQIGTNTRTMYQAELTYRAGTGATLISDTLYAGEYTNLMVAYDGAELVLYVNGQRDTATAVSGALAQTDDLEIGRVGSSYLQGYIDEVLVWSQAADSAFAYQNHGRYLIGNEAGLELYWRIDENSGDRVYDASRDDAIEDEVLKFNRRHGQMIGGTWASVVPDPELLGFAGFTNSVGNYTIPAIRYKGSGENFKVVPVFQTHEFDPTDRILFVGEGSAVHNDVNFTDVSSFKVTGFVKVDPAAFGYDPEDPDAPSCYIKGAYLNLDGNLVVKNNQPVTTDASGKFELEVPIGNHQLSVTMAGHTFSLGKWPVNTEYHNFQEPISGITFLDATQRHWVGKVVGGHTEGDIFPGFGNTQNNLGTADLRITSIGNACFVKEFSTDPASGEFYVSVPPLQYRVDEIEIASQGPTFNSELRQLTDEMIDLASPLMPEQGEWAKDTTFYVDNGDTSPQNIATIDSIEYHLRKDYIYEALPEILVFSRDSTLHFGEDTLAYADPLGAFSFIIPLETQSMGHPVFQSGIAYALRIYVMERYYNYDADRDHPAVYEVTVPESSIEIQNEIGGTTERVTLPEGYYVHQFFAGQPQTQEGGDFPLTKTLEITGPRGVKWLPNVGATEWEQVFRGYVVGSSAQGDNDFITVFDESDTATEGGVKMVDFILRDPPGSQSYAYWKENTTLKNFVDTKFSVGYFGQIQTSAGSSFTLYNFLSGNKLFENKAVMINSVSGKIAGGGRFVRETTYTTRQTITTNPDPYKPGAPSDLFIGSARNVLVGYADAVKLIPVEKCDEDGVYCTGPIVTNANGSFRLGKLEEFVISPEQNFATTFVYTQDHIEREMKTLADKRNRLFATPYYDSYLAADHPAYGANNTDDVLSDYGLTPISTLTTDTDDGPSYIYHRDADTREHPIDLVRFYNNQISIWKQVLAANEKEKIEAMNRANSGDSQRDNWSFGSGVKIESASGVTDRDLDAFNWEFELTLRRGTLIDTDATGVKVKLESYHGLQFKESGTTGTDSSSTTEIGYVLHDRDINDQISVDVIESHLNNGPIFVTRGGRTSCPWEPARTVKYYQPFLGASLSAGTVARDQPTIDIFPRSLHNIPAGEKAIFRVVLGNNNYTDSVRFYSLLMDSRTNPGGAELRIDEQRIVKSFSIPMYAGELQEKTLALQIAATDFEYEDIKIYFHSPCQFNLGTTFEKSIADSAYISAYFIPECTDVAFRTPTDKWRLNYGFNDTLDIAISEYNYNYYQFDNVKFQIKESSESDERWLTWNTFWHPDSEDRPDPATTPHDTIPNTQFDIDYYWDVAQLTDGQYDLRAITTCGPDDVVTTSPVYTGIIDRVNPHPFGRPQPRDGILGPGDEIQIQFNEDIDAGKLTWDNFDIRGVLNGGNLRHGASVAFDGTAADYLKINGLLMQSHSFTLEFWAKRAATGEAVVLSQGRPGTQQMVVGFNQNDRLYLELDGVMAVSDAQFTDQEWHHFAVSYDHDYTRARLYADGAVLKVMDSFVVDYRGDGPMYVARRGHTPEQPFAGQLHELRFWKKPMLLTDITVNFGKRMTGREIGLAGCWPLDEAEGTGAQDLAGGRTAEVYATWAVEPSSRSMAFAGTDHLTIPTGHFGFSTEMDFTLEWWYKSTGNREMTWFSNGKGTTEDESNIDWSVDVDANNRILVHNNGAEFVAVDSNFFDNNWHHFALVVNRLGNARAYIDGQLQNQVGSEYFTGFGSAKAWVGTRGWLNGTVDSVDRGYVGLLDEVRIWSVARTQDQLLRERHYRLRGDELGLMAYYPFEAYQEDAAGIMLLEETLIDQVEPKADTAISAGGTYATETPLIKLQRPVEYVNFIYSVNGDKIIISPTDDNARIENTILDITVRGVKDLNGNVMQSPATWSAFVDRNQTVWGQASLRYTKEVNEALTFTATVVNKGGNVEDFTIDNLPAWLTAEPASGSVQPLSSQLITFTVNQGLNIGQYHESLHLSTSFGFDEVLHLSLKVYEKSPVWTVDPSDYQYSMSMIGMLKVEGLISNDPEDKLAAFINGECRGVSNLRYISAYDTYLAYLNLYSNVSSGEEIVFQIWDASEGRVLTDVTPYIQSIPDFNYTFSANVIEGTSAQPVVFTSNQGILEQRMLPRGWKWISFHLDSDLLSRTGLVLQHLDVQDGDILWAGDGRFDQYDSVSQQWIGTLAGDNLASGVGGLENTATYKLKLANRTQLTYRGAELEPADHPITIQRGWNWIGFVSGQNLELNEALSSYDAQPGDVLKSQHQFAMYDAAIGWIGSLAVMQPGEGYMLYTDSVGERTFTYPRESIISGRGLRSFTEVEAEVLKLLPFDPYQYPSSMSVVATLDVPLHALAQPNQLRAYVNGELRGVAQPISLDAATEPVFLLTIYGHPAEGKITFAWEEAGKTYEVRETSAFADLSVQGTLAEPLRLSLKEAPEEAPALAGPESRAYPNPFTDRVEIWAPVAEAEASISIYDASGKRLHHVPTVPTNHGWLRYTWDGTTDRGLEAAKGVYLIKVEAEGSAQTYKVIKQ